MGKIKIYIVFLALVAYSLTSFVSASIINFNFDISANVTAGNLGIVYTGDIVFQVSTTEQVLCKYSTNKQTPFDSMEGFFDENFETLHKKTFTDLHDGVYRYFVRCRDISDINNQSLGLNELEAVFKISNPIAGQITLDEEILSSGKHKITLLTSKIPSSKPKLSYTYDGVTYTPILLQGASTSWTGFIIVSQSPVEEIGSFKFEATDLEGRKGDKIIGSELFEIDTLPPSTSSSIEATGEFGAVNLEWQIEEGEDVRIMNIYRSENPGVEATNLHVRVAGSLEEYEDTDTENGITYYYRFSGEDSAGNTAELSREISATTLRDSTGTSSTGLAPNLLGEVDAALTELDILKSEISIAKDNFESKGEKETQIIENLELQKSITNSLSEANAIRKELSNYKLQALTSETLNSRLGSSRVKMNILRRNVPTSISITDSNENNPSIKENDLRQAVLAYSPELGLPKIEKVIENSLDSIKENSFEVSGSLEQIEITYLDGKTSAKTLISYKIGSKNQEEVSTLLLLTLPKSLDSGEINFKSKGHTIEKENLISLNPEVREVSFTVEEALDGQTLNEVMVVPLIIAEETTKVTGYFLSEIPSGGSKSFLFLVMLAGGLVMYLMYMRKASKNESVTSFIEKAREVKELQKIGKAEEATSLYESLKLDYISLTEKEKSQVFLEAKNLIKK